MDMSEFEAKRKTVRDNIATHINMLHALRCGGLDAARSFLRGAMNAGDVAPDGWAAAAHNCHNADDMRSIAMEFLVGDIFDTCDMHVPEEDVIFVPVSKSPDKFNFDFPVFLEHATDEQAMDTLVKLIEFCNNIPGAHSLGYNEAKEIDDEEL
jgi:hypothetical protein